MSSINPADRPSRFFLASLRLCGAFFLLLSMTALADDAPRSTAAPDVERASKEMASNAKRFLDSLSPAQLATAGFEFKDNERVNWHFIPKPRKGLTLKDMSEDQRALAKGLL